MLAQKAEAREAAKILFKEYGNQKIPVPVEEIAQNAGVTVKCDPDLINEISGFFKRLGKDGKPVIVVNSKHPEVRQRFTIAHELGHYILHANNLLHVDTNKIYFRQSFDSSMIDTKEIEANSFAAELLMPEEKVFKDIQDEPTLSEDIDKHEVGKSIVDLANKYKVSDEAMKIRLVSILR